ncbi:nitroreductase family protein [Peptoniphilus asaccharolyticus]
MFKGLEKRRSYYNIGKNIPISDEELIKLVQDVTLVVPDAFNMQSQRVVVALGAKQEQLWDKIYDVFEGKVPREKIDSFKAGHGTILYFTDRKTVSDVQAQIPDYAEGFEIWSKHSMGMLQLVIWTELRDKEIGASLQHYNPVIDEAVRELFDIPEKWELIAQMPFGEILEEPEAKEKLAIDERVRVFK